MKVRELTGKDFYILSEIFADVMDEVAEQLKEGMTPQQAGVKIVAAAFKLVPTKINAFIQEITGITDAEKLPFTAPIKIVREVVNREEMKDFFHEMRELMQEIQKKS